MTLNVVMAVAVFRRIRRSFHSPLRKMIKDTPIHSANEMYPKKLVFSGMSYMAIFAGNHPSEGVQVKRTSVASENLTCNQP